MAEIQVEKDTLDVEDISNIHDFCKPMDDSILNQAQTFGLIYKRNIFDAWVKQPSPCCGAASVAGSINALLKIHRSADKAFNHSDILAVHKLLFIEKIKQKLNTFQRKVGCDVSTSILSPLSVIIGSLIKQSDGSKDTTTDGAIVTDSTASVTTTSATSTSFRANLTMKKALLFSAMEKFIQEYEAKPQKDELATTTTAVDAEKTKEEHIQQFEADALNIFIQLVKISIASRKESPTVDAVDSAENDNENSARDDSAETTAAASNESADVVASNTATEVTLSSSASLNSIDAINNNTPTTSKLKSKFSKVPSYASKSAAASNSTGSGDGIAGTCAAAEWSWSDDLMELFKLLSGYNKLNATPYPNTGPVGNVSVLQAVDRVSEFCGLGTYLKGKLFMGRRTGTNQKASASSRLEVPLSIRDDDDTITSQWNTLKNMFARQDSVLLFHLTNHYCLIFALREWAIDSPPSSTSSSVNVTGTGTVVRQMLCARKGQRPTAWVDFSEAREVMLNWEGYKVMSIQLQPQAIIAAATVGSTSDEMAVTLPASHGNTNATAVAVADSSASGDYKKHFTQKLEEELERIEFKETISLIKSYSFI